MHIILSNMHNSNQTATELPNIVSVIAERLGGGAAAFLIKWENVIFSLIVIAFLSLIAFIASRRIDIVPKGLANLIEMLVDAIDSFVCSIMGPKGRRFTPFIGTLFIYIVSMNMIGLIPFMKSPTASWSTTLGLAIVVFCYVQYTGLKELGLIGYADHMAGSPRGILAMSVVIPMIMLFLHIVSELVRPISLSLRLRSNIWGDDMLLAVLAGFGIKGVPLVIFNSMLMIFAGLVQAVVFCLLTTIYFTLVLVHDEH